MQKIIIGIFAHPDDEAFGPSGALLLETRAGTILHLITLTAGEAGMNPDQLSDLHKVRLDEWRAAGQLLGATSMHYLGYRDGQLCNQSMIEINQRLVETITALTKDAPADAVIELMTLDLNGFTGHIDHIVAARAACWAFYELKKADPRYQRIRLACIPSSELPQSSTEWIYREAGRSSAEIDETIDARSLRKGILAIMDVHHSQRADRDSLLARRGDQLGMDYFIVKD